MSQFGVYIPLFLCLFRGCPLNGFDAVAYVSVSLDGLNGWIFSVALCLVLPTPEAFAFVPCGTFWGPFPPEGVGSRRFEHGCAQPIEAIQAAHEEFRPHAFGPRRFGQTLVVNGKPEDANPCCGGPCFEKPLAGLSATPGNPLWMALLEGEVDKTPST